MSCIWRYTLEAWLKVRSQVKPLSVPLYYTVIMCESVGALPWPGERALLWATAQTNPPAEIISTKPSVPSSSSWDCSPSATEAQSSLCVEKLRVNHVTDQAEPVTCQKQTKGQGESVFNSLTSHTIQTRLHLLSGLTQNDPNSAEEINRSLRALGFRPDCYSRAANKLRGVQVWQQMVAERAASF